MNTVIVTSLVHYTGFVYSCNLYYCISIYFLQANKKCLFLSHHRHGHNNFLFRLSVLRFISQCMIIDNFDSFFQVSICHWEIQRYFGFVFALKYQLFFRNFHLNPTSSSRGVNTHSGTIPDSLTTDEQFEVVKSL